MNAIELLKAKEHFESLLSKIENEIVKNQLRFLFKYSDPSWVVTDKVKEHMRALLQGLAFQLSA